MTKPNGFIEQAKQQLDQLDGELNELEKKALTVSNNADVWFADRMSELRREWHEARRKVSMLANHEGAKLDATFEQTKAGFQKHHDALRAAAAVYSQRIAETEGKARV